MRSPFLRAFLSAITLGSGVLADLVIFRNPTKQYNKNAKHNTTLRTSYAMLPSGIPWNIPRVTCVFFVYTRAFRRVCMQRKCKWEWDILRYTTRKPCITILYHVTEIMWYYIWCGGIPANIQRFSRILIGCIFYGEVWNTIQKQYNTIICISLFYVSKNNSVCQNARSRIIQRMAPSNGLLVVFAILHGWFLLFINIAIKKFKNAKIKSKEI